MFRVRGSTTSIMHTASRRSSQRISVGSKQRITTTTPSAAIKKESIMNNITKGEKSLATRLRRNALAVQTCSAISQRIVLDLLLMGKCG